MPNRIAAMTMESPGNSSTRTPRVSARIPDTSVDFHRCGNNLGTAVVSMLEVSHKRRAQSKILQWESDAGRLGCLGTHTAGSGFWFAANEIPSAHEPFPLDFDGTPLLKDEVVFQSL